MLTAWERGYRCHGYWLNGHRRLGLVGLGPPRAWDGVYRWYIDGTDRYHSEEGEAKTLRAAKRAVEQRCRALADEPPKEPA